MEYANTPLKGRHLNCKWLTKVEPEMSPDYWDVRIDVLEIYHDQPIT